MPRGFTSICCAASCVENPLLHSPFRLSRITFFPWRYEIAFIGEIIIQFAISSIDVAIRSTSNSSNILSDCYGNNIDCLSEYALLSRELLDIYCREDCSCYAGLYWCFKGTFGFSIEIRVFIIYTLYFIFLDALNKMQQVFSTDLVINIWWGIYKIYNCWISDESWIIIILKVHCTSCWKY